MIRISVLVVVVWMLLGGCVYYNTFFNAEKFFREAQEMALNENGDPTSGAVQNYNKTIKKCGIVLTDYKDSQYADDALFLMARCFYYIGRNQTQAIKHFEELLEFYPESEFVPDARLYIARANYQFNRKELAFELLQEFLKEADLKDHHPKALQLLADYHLADKNFVEADYYLNRIIEKFPKSEEYASAFFLQAKAQHEAGNYEKSNEVFFSLLKSKVPRNMKFDARYYITLNYLKMEDFQQAEKYALRLLRDEYREDKISRIHLLKARSLAGNGHYEDAIQLYNTVITDNPRTMLSAEACFHLGELYFNKLHDYEKAIEHYNKVKTEYNKSDYMEQALTRSSVASQIIQFHNPSSQLSVEELVLQQFKLAEFFIEYMDLPDSALIVYDHITQQKDSFIQKLDSLRLNLKAYQDSLSAIREIETKLMEMGNIEQQIQESESKEKLEKEKEFAASDSARTEEMAKPDSLIITEKIFPDSLMISEEIETDSLQLTAALSDSGFAAKKETSSLTLAEVSAEKQRLQSLAGNLTTQIDRNEQDIIEYDEEFIPFAEFIKLWLYRVVYQDSLLMQMQYDKLIRNFPDNKYAYAAELMHKGEPVELTTRQQILELAQYEKAIEKLDIYPDSAKVLLQEIAADSTHSFYLKANYSLGFLNHFLLADSLQAKQHYDIVLAATEDSEYRTAVQKLYDGKELKVASRLPALIQWEQKQAAAKEEEARKQAEIEKTANIDPDKTEGKEDEIPKGEKNEIGKEPENSEQLTIPVEEALPPQTEISDSTKIEIREEIPASETNENLLLEEKAAEDSLSVKSDSLTIRTEADSLKSDSQKSDTISETSEEENTEVNQPATNTEN